jgi:hypothetical protein
LLRRAIQRRYELQGEMDEALVQRVRQQFDARYLAGLIVTSPCSPGSWRRCNGCGRLVIAWRW